MALEHELVELQATQNTSSVSSSNLVSGHALRHIPIGNKEQCLFISCVDEFSPLDCAMFCEDEAPDITGHRIWDACSISIAIISSGGLKIPRINNFVEVGAGSGTFGLALATMTSGLALLTDGEDITLDLMKKNASLNKGRIDPEAKVICSKLRWGFPKEARALCEQQEVRSFDFCFANDCIYNLSNIPALFETAHALLAEKTRNSSTFSQGKFNPNEILEPGCFVLCNVMNRVLECKLEKLEELILESARNAGFQRFYKIEEASSLVPISLSCPFSKAIKRTNDLNLPLLLFWV